MNLFFFESSLEEKNIRREEDVHANNPLGRLAYLGKKGREDRCCRKSGRALASW